MSASSLLIASVLLGWIPACPPDTIRISEIHFAPSDPGLEFVELFNAADQEVRLDRLSLSDAQSEPVLLPAGLSPLPSGSYLVLVRDPDHFADRWPHIPAVPVRPWPALNNAGDDVIIRRGDRIVDEVTYLATWHDPRIADGAQRSLERVDVESGQSRPTSWTTSAHPLGGTPGEINTASTKRRGQRPQPGDIVITEILFEPLQDRLPGQPEFVEFGIVRSGPVDPNGVYLVQEAPGSAPDSVRVGYAPDALIRGDAAVAAWKIPGSDIPRLGLDLALAFPGSAGRLTADRVWPANGGRALRNAGAILTLFASDGTRLDRVVYGPDRHHPALRETAGVSLHRVDWEGPSDEQSNWTSSTHPDGATPGYRMEAVRQDEGPVPGVRAEPTVITPDSDLGARVAAIRVHLFEGDSITDVRVFDVEGRRVRLLANGRPSHGPDVVYWNGLNDRGLPMPAGPYVILVQAWSANGGFRSRRVVVVVARA